MEQIYQVDFACVQMFHPLVHTLDKMRQHLPICRVNLQVVSPNASLMRFQSMKPPPPVEKAPIFHADQTRRSARR